MRKLEASDLRKISLLKHYRIVRRWACRNYGLNDADLELLIYFDCMDFFSKNDFKTGVYAYSWDNNRFSRLLKEGWIVVWRHGNKKDKQYSLYKVALKANMMISRIYRILLGDEPVPTGRRQPVMKSNAYTDTVLRTAIKNINNDKK